MSSESRKDCVPTDEELRYLGFEPWQLDLVHQLPTPELMWEAHDEYIRRLMQDEPLDRPI